MNSDKFLTSYRHGGITVSCKFDISINYHAVISDVVANAENEKHNVANSDYFPKDVKVGGVFSHTLSFARVDTNDNSFLVSCANASESDKILMSWITHDLTKIQKMSIKSSCRLG